MSGMNPLPPVLETVDGPMLLGSSPSLLADLLVTLEEEVIAAGAPLEDWVQEGLSREVIVEKLSAVDLETPDELVTWFGWHNGFREPRRPPGGSPIPNFPFASLESALDRYRSLVLDFRPPSGPSAPDSAVFEFGAGKGWLRLVADNWGLAIECMGSQHTPPRLHCATEDFAFEPDAYRAVSLCTFVSWQIEGIHNGGYRWSGPQKMWVADDQLLPVTQKTARFW